MPSLLEIGANFDWITPTIAFLDGWLFGPTYKFMIAVNPILTAAQMKAGLRKRGVRVRNSMVVGDTILIWVSLKQAGWANHVLTKIIGVLVLNPPQWRKRR